MDQTMSGAIPARRPGRGRFLTLEGVDGAGKSTQLPRIEDWLRRRGVETLVTREPGGTPLGERLRALLLDPQFAGMSPVAELLVLFAARAEHLHARIAPAIADGVWVLCERFTDATFAYQGGGRNIDPATIAALEDAVQGEIRPDLVIVFDLPVEVALRRAAERAGAADRFEHEDAGFFRRVRDGYLGRAREHPERYAIVDASVDERTVTEHAVREIAARFP